MTQVHTDLCCYGAHTKQGHNFATEIVSGIVIKLKMCFSG